MKRPNLFSASYLARISLFGLACVSLNSCQDVRSKISNALSSAVESSESDEGSLIKTVTATEVDSRLRYTKGKMVVIFWSKSDKDSAWLEECCCQILNPHGDDVEFVKVNVKKDDEALERLGEREASVIRFYEDGYCVGRLTELQSSEQLNRFVTKWVMRDKVKSEDEPVSSSSRSSNSRTLPKRTAEKKPEPTEASKAEVVEPAKKKVAEKESAPIQIRLPRPKPIDLNTEPELNPLPPGVSRLKPGEIADRRSKSSR